MIVVLQVRSLAANSQRVREEMRARYGKDNFDKKALETQLQSQVFEKGRMSAAKNKSTVILA